MKAEQLEREVEMLFKTIDLATHPEERRPLFERLASDLVTNEPARPREDTTAASSSISPTDILGESLVEHGLVEISIPLSEI